MKLELDEIVEKFGKKSGGSISQDKPFMDSLTENIGKVMNILEQLGIKEIFIEKAKSEVRQRFFGRQTNPNDDIENLNENTNPGPLMKRFDPEKIAILVLLWLDKFIQDNGDMMLSEFRQHLENRKDEFINLLKQLDRI